MAILAFLKDRTVLILAGIGAGLLVLVRFIASIRKSERDSLRAGMAARSQELQEQGNEAANAARRTGSSELLRDGKF